MTTATRTMLSEKFGWDEQPTLLDICLDLHMGNNGSGDPWALDRDFCVKVLTTALETWEDDPGFCKPFDDAVRNLIVVTLDEDRRHRQQLN